MHTLTDHQLLLLRITLVFDAIVAIVLMDPMAAYPVRAAGIVWLFRAISGLGIIAGTTFAAIRSFLVNTSFVCVAALVGMLLTSVWVDVPVNQNCIAIISILGQMSILHYTGLTLLNTK